MAIQNYLTLSHLRKAVASITQKINNLKSDWNAKAGEEGYIANRTHWKEEQTVVIAEEQTIVMESDSTDIQPANGITEPEFNAGDLLIVTLNGNTYELEAIDNGEPYAYVQNLIWRIDNCNLYISFNPSNPIPESITISITKKNVVYHQLDNKYINGKLIQSGTGVNSEIFNDYVHNSADGTYSHAEGYGTVTSGNYSHAEGAGTIASGGYSHAEGSQTTASGNYSHAEGYHTQASGEYSHAEGYSTTSKAYSHAEGYLTKASGNYSHAEGSDTTAYGHYSHAEGYSTEANGDYSHVEGRDTTASGDYSHAEGYYTTASGVYSHVEGLTTTAQRRSQHVFGEYNILDTEGSSTSSKGTYIEIVGNGTSSVRSNARTLDWSGNEVLAGKLTVGTAPTNNMDVATKQYVDNSINASSISPDWNENDTTSANYIANKPSIKAGTGTGSVIVGSPLNVSSNTYSYAEGDSTTASGSLSHAEGNNTIACGANSHSEGNNTVSQGENAHAEGFITIAYGANSHSEGIGEFFNLILTGNANSVTYTAQSIPSGLKVGVVCNSVPSAFIKSIDRTNNKITTNKTLSTSAVSNKTYTFTTAAKGNASHMEGYGTQAVGNYSHAEGEDTYAENTRSHAEGYGTTASGENSHAEGASTTASGNDSHAEGYYVIANAFASHAEGYDTTASGSYSHAEGYDTTASGYSSHTEGNKTTASGSYSHAEGDRTTASGDDSHTEGWGSKATAIGAHAEGYFAEAKGEYSHAEGLYTNASSDYQHVSGKSNIIDANDTYAEIVGNGTDSSNRSNARTLDWNGNEVLAGKLTVGTAPTNNMDVATKQYVDNAIPTVPTASSTTPSADGTGAVGTSTAYARADHVHPKITQALSISSNILTLTSSDGTTSSVTIPTSGGGGSTGGASSLSELNDTTITSLTNGQILRFDSSSSKWINSNEITYTFDGTYNASTNKAATVSTVTNAIGALTIPTKTSDLTNDSGFMTGMTILSYGNSTWANFIDVYTNKRVVYCRASSNANPATGSQTRLAFMAYVNNADNPTEVEFQYYRSVNGHSNNQQGDQVYVYKLTKSSGWSVTVRECYTKVVAGTGLNGNWANGAITLGLSSTIPVGSTATPQPLGTASAGSSSDFSKADHVHALPTLSISSNVITLTGASGQTTSITLPVYNGGVSSS